MRGLAAGGARLRVVGLPTDDVPAVERLSDPLAAVRGARAVIAPMSGADAARVFANAFGSRGQHSPR